MCVKYLFSETMATVGAMVIYISLYYVHINVLVVELQYLAVLCPILSF